MENGYQSGFPADCHAGAGDDRALALMAVCPFAARGETP